MIVEYTAKVETLTGGILHIKKPNEKIQKIRAALLAECELKHGGFITIRMSTPHRPRSTGRGSQSAHFHGHVQTIAQATGQPAEDVKTYLKAKAIDRGYPMMKDENGDPILNLWGFYQGISERDASVENEIALIETAHQFADEFGIILIEEAAA